MSKEHLGHYYGPAPSDAELGIGKTSFERILDNAVTKLRTMPQHLRRPENRFPEDAAKEQ